ncbi:MAG: CRISPR-associated ring nuclease Csm6 [Thermodesulfobacteriota bacterium]|nr:CRISPR-associated ring nuclease Csm6 [Thermodesulfobacteriota bacterium]
MKHILLAVIGLSPQIITETLYALHQREQKVDAIHVITTTEGKKRIHAELLGNGDGMFHRYIKDYAVAPPIDFAPPNIHTLTDPAGNEIADIITSEHNNDLLNKCLELAFRFTGNPETAIYFSIAGGRKTMSACLTLAAQLYGRPRDRLYHVLVSPEFESSPNFYYPPPDSTMVQLRNHRGEPYYKETRYADINLVEMPILSLRQMLPPDYLEKPEAPGDLILSAFSRQTQPDLIIDFAQRKIAYGRLELDLMPAHFALYAFFAGLKINCPDNKNTCDDCRNCFLETRDILTHQPPITAIYHQACPGASHREMSTTGITCLTTENFNAYKSKINRQIREKFGPHTAALLEITAIGRKPDKRHGLPIDRTRIATKEAKEII